MSFLKSLFGMGGAKEPKAPSVDAQDEYKGYTIKAMLMPAGGEHQLAGTIEKDFGGEVKKSYKLSSAPTSSAIQGRCRGNGAGQGPPDHRRTGRSDLFVITPPRAGKL